MSTENEETRQRLKAAVHFNVGRICQAVGEKGDLGEKEFSRHVMAAIAETTFRQCDVFAKDLEAFARHAKRSTINAEDVKLLARRSKALSKYIQKKSEELASSNQEKRELKKSTGKKKNVDTEDMES